MSDSNRRYNGPVALGMTDALGIKPRPLPYAMEGAGDYRKPLLASGTDCLRRNRPSVSQIIS